MNEFEKLESALIRAGRAMECPATPGIAARVRAELTSPPAPLRRGEGRLGSSNWSRILVPLGAALILALVLLFAFPDARDAVAQFLGLRGLRIFYATPTSPPTPLLQGEGSVAPFPSSPSERGVGGEGTPSPTTRGGGERTPTVQPFALCCATTLADAQARARFKLLLPPNETPSRVYYQNIYDSGEQIVMIFGDPENPCFTLYQAQRWVYGKMIGDTYGKSVGPQTLLSETTVNGVRALWFSGAPHLVMMLDARGEPIYETQRVVDANTLVWETHNVYDGIIYRLETKLSLDEAVRFAESFQEYR